jgi:beta-phosphoglucomutase-like phosphatase (HAD superfamily)
MYQPAHPATADFDAVLFDLDGVVTRTASLHAAAWAELFDDFLRARAASGGEPFHAFDPQADYLAYVDGKPRHEGVRSFLAARSIELPEGGASDDPQALTVHGLARRKDALFQHRLRRDGVEVFASTVELIRALRDRGVKTGVVTSSRNGREVLAAAGIEDLFDARVDGLDAEALGLKGKPDPDPFLACARQLGSLLVIGWHGRFMAGHAAVLKHLVQVVTCPLLLVKPATRVPFRLKVGEEIG